jgi:hypothetical protein
MYYPTWAGGKFITNCLSLSRHAVPQNKKIAEYLIDNPTDYQFRLDAVLSTLPPKEKMTDWRNGWEFGDTDFFQGNVSEYLENWKQGKTKNLSTDNLLSNLISNNMCFFMVAHSGGISAVKAMSDVWKQARIIGLINYQKFWSIAKKLKDNNTNHTTLMDYAGNDCNDKYQLIKGDDWPCWELFEKYHYDVDKLAKHVKINDSIKQEIESFYQWNQIKNQLFCFDVDSTYFDKDKFLKKIEELYNWVEFDDYNPDLVEQYYHRYMTLHTDTTKEE